jgi:hypothetical protein
VMIDHNHICAQAALAMAKFGKSSVKDGQSVMYSIIIHVLTVTRPLPRCNLHTVPLLSYTYATS